MSTADPRVIFVGNSCTYFNDLPEMLRHLVPGLRYVQVTKGGQGLSGHASDPVVQWMITGDGTMPDPSCRPRSSHDQCFFDDGEGWDVLVLQDRADSITDKIRGSDMKFQESLSALDIFAAWVQIAAGKMQRRPSVIVFHRCLYSFKEMAQRVDTKLLCAKGAEGIQQYVARLATHLGPNVPISIMPAMEAYSLVRNEGPDVFRKMYAADGEHPSRIGTYVMALLFFYAITGRSPLNAPYFLPTDDDTRQHVDSRCAPEQWISSDAWQRDIWPHSPLPAFTDELTQRLRMWAHQASSGQIQQHTHPASPKSNQIPYTEGYLQKVCEVLGREVQGTDVLKTALNETLAFDELVALAGDQLKNKFPIEVNRAIYREREQIRAMYPRYYDASIVSLNPDGTVTVNWEDNDPDDTIKTPQQIRQKSGLGTMLRVGSLVEAEFHGWHRAVVSKVHDNGSYTIDWADNDTRDRIKWPSDMRKEEAVFAVGEHIRAVYPRYYDASIASIHPDGIVVVKWDDNDTDDTIKTFQQIRPKADPGAVLQAGDFVEAEFRGWHRAIVNKINGDGSYTIDWADNDERDRIKWPSDMRKLEQTANDNVSRDPPVVEPSNKSDVVKGIARDEAGYKVHETVEPFNQTSTM